MRTERENRLFWCLVGAASTVAGTFLLVSALLAATSEPAAGSGPAPGRPGSARASTARSRFSTSAQLRRAQVFARVQADSAFRRLGEPQPGEWLWHFREPGQTLEEYTARAVNRKSAVRKRLHLLPFTDLSAAQLGVVEPMREHTAIFFDTEALVLPRRAPRQSWLDARRGQYNADSIVRQLAREVQPDSLGLFGLMGSDLYGLGLNFVFGEALLDRRAGVYSVHRFGQEPGSLLRRALKLSAHEIGHLFGLQHCVFYECVMNGTNSLDETDRRPVHLCPVCLAKLQWNLRFDPARRARALAAFYRKHNLFEEARFAAARVAEL